MLNAFENAIHHATEARHATTREDAARHLRAAQSYITQADRIMRDCLADAVETLRKRPPAA